MINASLSGDRELIVKLGDVVPQVQAELRKAVDLMAMKTLARVKLKLSDDVLRVRTGRLRRSITQMVTDNGTAIMGTVGTNVEYAKTHELGFSGTQDVRAHLRTIKVAFGKSLKGGAVVVPVGPYTRREDFPPRSFLATAMAELEPEFIESVNQAVAKAVKSINAG
jgi:phage gpG-like protein